MPITLDAGALRSARLLGSGGTVSASPPRSAESSRLLVLLNPGRVSRHYLEGLARGAVRLGLELRTCELAQVWQRSLADAAGLSQAMAELLRRERIGAVVSYVFTGLTEMIAPPTTDGRVQTFFESLGIPHLLLWTDHPQWASEKAALAPHFQPLLRSPNNHHFLKCASAAEEVRTLLGWLNCYGLPVAEDEEMVQPQPQVVADYDVVAIVGSPPTLDEALKPFLEQDDPDVAAIQAIVADRVREKLAELWRRDAPPDRREQLTRLGDDWLERRRSDERTAAFRHVGALGRDHPDAWTWLAVHPGTYFDAVEHLWQFGGWQRTFMLCYLARHFRVGVFGADWSSVGLGGGSWVPYDQQAATYARGKLAINISQGSEEEGVSHKPFQIAASGVPLVHVDRRGLSECFEPGEEVAVFSTPREAREVIGDLLADPQRRRSLAAAARARFEREHTWSCRLAQMLARAALPLSAFRSATAG